MTGGRRSLRLVVDGAICDAHGICALVLPERISLDAWGYAVVASDPLGTARELARARRAVFSCPARALSLVEVSSSAPSSAAGPASRALGTSSSAK